MKVRKYAKVRESVKNEKKLMRNAESDNICN